MVFSDWSFVYGWLVVLKFNLIPKEFWRLSHSLEVNWWSLSDTIEIRIPYNLTTSFTYIMVSLSTGFVIFIGKNMICFVNLSTITYIVLFPVLLFGSPITKSIVMSSHFHSGIKRGCNPPTCFWCSIFTCWHTTHLATYPTISFFIFWPSIKTFQIPIHLHTTRMDC